MTVSPTARWLRVGLGCVVRLRAGCGADAADGPVQPGGGRFPGQIGTGSLLEHHLSFPMGVQRLDLIGIGLLAGDLVSDRLFLRNHVGRRRLVLLAVGETVILLHPPLPLVGVSIAMERERQQNDSLANG